MNAKRFHNKAVIGKSVRGSFVKRNTWTADCCMCGSSKVFEDNPPPKGAKYICPECLPLVEAEIERRNKEIN